MLRQVSWVAPLVFMGLVGLTGSPDSGHHSQAGCQPSLSTTYASSERPRLRQFGQLAPPFHEKAPLSGLVKSPR